MPNRITGQILQSLCYLEERLQWDQETRVTLHDLAEQAYLSDYHFLRIFKGMTGFSPLHYVRRRQLSRASERLLESGDPILQIAQDASYESQEAFTRAFKDMFALTPAQARRNKNDLSFLIQNPIVEEDINHLISGGITLEPEIVSFEEIRVIGITKTFSFGDTEGVKNLWQDFVRNNNQSAVAYGVCQESAQGGYPNEEFQYTCGYEKSKAKDMDSVIIQEGQYARFLHTGHVDTYHRTLQYIWCIWLPKSGYALANKPDFERYDERFHEETLDGTFEVYLPLAD